MSKTLDEIAKDYLRGMYGDEPGKVDVREDYVERVIAAYGYEPQWDANWVRSAFECGKNESTSRWISVKDKMPSRSVECVARIVNDSVRYTEVLHWNQEKGGWSGLIYGHKVTHWIELPDSPVVD